MTPDRVAALAHLRARRRLYRGATVDVSLSIVECDVIEAALLASPVPAVPATEVICALCCTRTATVDMCPQCVGYAVKGLGAVALRQQLAQLRDDMQTSRTWATLTLWVERLDALLGAAPTHEEHDSDSARVGESSAR